jgi:hypothetical protein
MDSSAQQIQYPYLLQHGGTIRLENLYFGFGVIENPLTESNAISNNADVFFKVSI